MMDAAEAGALVGLVAAFAAVVCIAIVMLSR